MFDPYPFDPLVSRPESSVDKYQIILPLSLVVNAVILEEYRQLNSDQDESLIFFPSNEGNESKNEELEAQKDNEDEKENESENEQTPKKGKNMLDNSLIIS